MMGIHPTSFASLNRTLVVLKFLCLDHYRREWATLNRTLVVLKSPPGSMGAPSSRTLNRTLVVLKLANPAKAAEALTL